MEWASKAILEAGEILEQVTPRADQHDDQPQPWSVRNWYALAFAVVVRDTFMNIQHYKQRLLDLENTLFAVRRSTGIEEN